MTLETAITFFGWCTVINFGILLLSTVALLAFRKPVTNIHAKMFGMDDVALSQEYFRYLGQYKIATIVLSLVPYLALKIIGAEQILPPL